MTRTIVIGGRNKYLVNGHAVQANTVADLFHAVQLNVNNPHFLIMQVRSRPHLPHQAGAHLCARVPALVPPRPTRAPHHAAARPCCSQGRITKVLNMKPPEILGMIEEAAGTRMYETKKQAAVKTIEKKQVKVGEIEKILAEDITPNLKKLQAERASYLQWAKNNTDAERLSRLVIAAEVVSAEGARAAAVASAAAAADESRL